MSICVALAVPDGIALAADSQTTWHQTITEVETKDGTKVELAKPIQIPIGWSKMARKLFRLSFNDQVYAFCTAGAASLNRKTVYSILKSAEATYEGDGKYSGVVDHCRDVIWAELKKELNCDTLSEAPIMIIELIVGGFSNEDVSQPILEVHFLFSGTPQIEGKPDASGHWTNSAKSNCYWIGRKEFLSHLVNHSNPKLPPLSGQYHLMSLEDAKDYVQFLVEYTCDFERFAVMVPDCGRPIVVASLVPGDYAERIV